MKYIILLNIIALCSCERVIDDTDKAERVVQIISKAEKEIQRELDPKVYTVQKGNDEVTE